MQVRETGSKQVRVLCQVLCEKVKVLGSAGCQGGAAILRREVGEGLATKERLSRDLWEGK